MLKFFIYLRFYRISSIKVSMKVHHELFCDEWLQHYTRTFENFYVKLKVKSRCYICKSKTNIIRLKRSSWPCWTPECVYPTWKWEEKSKDSIVNHSNRWSFCSLRKRYDTFYYHKMWFKFYTFSSEYKKKSNSTKKLRIYINYLGQEKVPKNAFLYTLCRKCYNWTN